LDSELRAALDALSAKIDAVDAKVVATRAVAETALSIAVEARNEAKAAHEEVRAARREASVMFETILREIRALPEGLSTAGFELVDDGHNVPVFGGDEEDDIIRNRLRERGHDLIDGPSFFAGPSRRARVISVRIRLHRQSSAEAPGFSRGAS
jgi:hypothetical protein